jgi:hypothetical protein
MQLALPDGIRLKIKKQYPDDEWKVEWRKNGQLDEPKSYYTDDLDDAKATMHQMSDDYIYQGKGKPLPIMPKVAKKTHTRASRPGGKRFKKGDRVWDIERDREGQVFALPNKAGEYEIEYRAAAYHEYVPEEGLREM